MKWILIFFAMVAAAVTGLVVVDPFASNVAVSASKRGTAVSAVAGHVTVSAATKMDVRSEVQGDVAEIIKPPRSAARRISRGDPIVVLDTEEIDIEIAIARADYEQARELLEMESHLIPLIEGLEKELADQEVLLKAGKIAPSTVENTRRNLRRHQSMLRAEDINRQRLYDRNKAMLDRLLLRKRKMTMYSPTDGTLDVVLVNIGETVRNNTKVAEVVGDRRSVMAEVSEEDLDGITSGQAATVRLLAYGDRLFQGTVGWLAHTANEDTKRRNISINLDIDRDLLVPGLTGQASIVKGERENAILVPRRALVGNSLYVVHDGRIEVREVEVGLIGVGMAEIISGLDERELVIVETPHIYRHGERVRIAEIIPF